MILVDVLGHKCYGYQLVIYKLRRETTSSIDDEDKGMISTDLRRGTRKAKPMDLLVLWWVLHCHLHFLTVV